MKTTTVVVAFLTACGTVNTLPGSGDDSGNGSGSDLEPHPPGVLYGHVHDERGDTIDFSTGEPVHAHAGASIDLSAGCPAVYKYAYLMDQHDPIYGRQTTKNPLAWHITSPIASLDDSATAYRVRADDGRVLLDWTTAAPDASGLYTIELVRTGDHGIAALGTDAGTMHLDLRFRDTAGTETVESACWEHHPLAAPVEVASVQAADLFQLSLPANSPISPLVNASGVGLGYGVDVASQRIVQHTAEPVRIAMSIARPTGMVTGTVADAFLATGTSTALVGCGDSPCETTAYLTAYTSIAKPVAGTWVTRVVDEVGNWVPCDTQEGNTTDIDCTLPARAAGAPPHAYRVVLALGGEASLGAALGPVGHGEYTAAALSYTGNAPVANAGSTCNQQQVKTTQFGTYFTCTSTTTFAHVVALDQARIDFDPIVFQLATGPAANAAVEPAPYVAPAAMSLGALTWDGGSEGL